MTKKTQSIGGWFFAVLVLLTGAFWLSHTQPDEQLPPQAGNAPGFSAHHARQQLNGLFDAMPAHPMGSPANRKMAQRLTDALQAMGYHTERQTGYACSEWMNCGYVDNLIAYLKKPLNGNGVLLNAHYDSVVSGPGVSDNGVNLAVALEIARLNTERPGQNPLVLLFSDGEEIDALGSKAFVDHPLAAQMAVAVNLEARGSSGHSLMFETSRGSAPLVELLGDNFTGVKTNSIFHEVYRFMPNQSDFTNLVNAGMAGYNFAFIGSPENYHTRNDDLNSVNYGSLNEQGRAASALVEALVRQPDLKGLQQDNSQALYTDLGGALLLSWSPKTALILAFAMLVLTVYVVFVKVPAPHKKARMVGGLLCVLLNLVVGVATCYGLMILITVLQPVALPWNNYAGQSHLVVWVGSLLIGALLYDLLTKKHDLFEQTGGFLLYFTLMTLALTFVAPGASYLYLLPLLPAALLMLGYRLLLALGRDKPWLVNLAVASMTVLYGLLASDIAYLVEQAMHLGGIGMILPIFLAPVGMLLAALSKTSGVERKVQFALYGVATLVVAGGLWQIAQSVDRPVKQIANLIRFQGNDKAHWQLGSSYQRLAPALKSEFKFKPTSPEVPLYKRYRRAVVLPTLAEGTSRWSTLEQVDLADGMRQLTVWVKPADTHHYVKLKLPGGFKAASLTINGQAYQLQPKRLTDREGYQVISLYGDMTRQTEVVLTYRPEGGADELVIDEEVVAPGLFTGDKLFSEYQKYYLGQNKGNRAIYQYRRKL